MISHEDLTRLIRDIQERSAGPAPPGTRSAAPEVTVAMPAYNSAPYIRAAIASVLRQEGISFELIVVDDGSQDRTSDVVRSFDDPRVRLETNRTNRGIGYSHNVALAHCRSPYVCHLDADDLLLPGALRRAVDALRAVPDAGQACALHYEVAEDGSIAREEFDAQTRFLLGLAAVARDYRRDLVVHGMVANPLRTYPRAVFDTVGGFNEVLRYGVDYEMTLRIADRYDVAFVPEFLYVQRVHRSNVQQNLRLRNLRFWWMRVGICRRLLRSQGALVARRPAAIYGLLGVGLLHVLRVPALAKRLYRWRRATG